MGGKTRRCHACRAAADAADGAFLTDPLSQILIFESSSFLGTSARRGRFVGMWKKSANQPAKKSAKKSVLLLAGALTASFGAAGAQQPPTPATPSQQTAPPAPVQSTNCAPMQPNGL